MKAIVKTLLVFFGGAATLLTVGYALIGVGMSENEIAEYPETGMNQVVDKMLNGWRHIIG